MPSPPPASRLRAALARPAVRVAAVVLAGFLYGFGTAHLPASTSGTRMWAANLSAPYLLLPFLAGAWAFRRPAAAPGAGALASASAIAGFYNLLGVGDVTNASVDAAPTVTARQLVLEAYGRWFSTFLLGDPGGTPWLTIALVSGALLGLVGFAWRSTRRWWLAAPVGAAFLLEPVASLVVLPLVNRIRFGVASPGYSLEPANLALWTAEVLVGALLVALAARLRRSPVLRSRPESLPAADTD
jgi:hypothetical protein